MIQYKGLQAAEENLNLVTDVVKDAIESFYHKQKKGMSHCILS